MRDPIWYERINEPNRLIHAQGKQLTEEFMGLSAARTGYGDDRYQAAFAGWRTYYESAGARPNEYHRFSLY